MSVSAFIQRQVTHIRRGGSRIFLRKLRKAARLAFALPFHVLAVPAVIAIRLIRPWLLIRSSAVDCTHLGHFAIDTELYLCERNAGINRPGRRHLDLFYMPAPACNQQLAKMWRQELRLWPEWFLAPIRRVDRMIPGEAIPECGETTQGDRDVHNLLDRFAPHLQFAPEEEARGEAGLRTMGIAAGKPFVCLNVRDCAYEEVSNKYSDYDWSHSNFRNSDIQNYVLAAETLADLGYVVVRMGAIVREPINTSHPGVIDYATNGMRSDFMDIYLGAKCAFCVSTGTGFDSVPMIFRRPIAFANYVPLGHLHTYRTQILAITKHFHLATDNRRLKLAEIFVRGAGLLYLTPEYQAGGIRLVDNTPEEIRDLALEMAGRLQGTWQPREEDEALQQRFWEILPKNAPEADKGRPWHGEIRSRFGAAFLRANRSWLDR